MSTGYNADDNDDTESSKHETNCDPSQADSEMGITGIRSVINSNSNSESESDKLEAEPVNLLPNNLLTEDSSTLVGAMISLLPGIPQASLEEPEMASASSSLTTNDDNINSLTSGH